jgi:hypothetical protein
MGPGGRPAPYGRLVNNPPKKNPNPRIESQCGQEYMISFLMMPETSRSTLSGTDVSTNSLCVLSSVTTCLQCGHLAMPRFYHLQHDDVGTGALPGSAGASVRGHWIDQPEGSGIQIADHRSGSASRTRRSRQEILPGREAFRNRRNDPGAVHADEKSANRRCGHSDGEGVPSCF